MRNNLEVYQARLTVLGPVFVGSGAEFSKKEYLFLNNRKTVGILDMQKLYRLVTKKGLQSRFEDFMLKSDRRKNLSEWLMENRINIQEAKECMKYSLDSGDTSIQRGTPVQIMECIKDPYGFPYIPGSSIKGMLRTILLCGRILQNPENFREEKGAVIRTVRNRTNRVSRARFLYQEKGRTEEKGFHCLNRNERRKEDAVNDELSGMIVSDSRPLTPDDLVLCQKIERGVDGTEKNLNLLRECFRPGTQIDFTITVEKDICSVRREEILRSVELFNEAYYKYYLSAFAGADRPRKGQVYLGGGAGFVSKTFLYPLLGKEEGLNTVVGIFKATGVPENHKHFRDVKYGVSPHILKCTHYQGQSMQMGCCRLEFL